MKPENFNGKFENAFNRQKYSTSSSDKIYIPEGVYKLYFNSLRKILIISYLATNAVFYGMGKDFSVSSEYQISQGLECFLILLMLGDVLLNIILTRMVRLIIF